jgi:HSP20 family molecular chaperone IbpA
MLDDVSFGRHPAFGSFGFPQGSRFGPTQEMFNNLTNQPAIDVSDHGNHFTVEADLPGVPKENVSVRVGDKGHSITIEGKVTETGGTEPSKTSATNDNSKDAETAKGDQRFVFRDAN